MSTINNIFFSILILVLCIILASYSNNSNAKNITTGYININQASIDELQLVPGIGYSTAKKIISAREKKVIKSITDLKSKKIIHNIQLAIPFIRFTGDSKYDKNHLSQNNYQRKINKKDIASKNQKKQYLSNHKTDNLDLNSYINDTQKIQLLTNKSYIKKVNQLIDQARFKILISSFIFKTTKSSKSTINKYIKKLAQAVKRGLQVIVILEKSNYHKEVYKFNQQTAKRLRKHGIKVLFDSPNKTLHSKLMIFDNYISIIGSHNLTNSALTRNYETSILIESKSLAMQLTSYLDAIIGSN